MLKIYKSLNEINKAFCEKLVQVKKTCTAIAPLMLGSYDTLNCSETELKNDITMTVHSSYKLVADNLYESTAVSGIKQKIEFTAVTGSKDVDVRFIDLNKLILQNNGGGASSAAGTGFELFVNGELMFTAADLESNGGNNYKIKLSKFLEISKSSACNVSIAELDEIKSKIRSKYD